MKLRSGTVVVLEGLDGSGKSTQAGRLQQLFPDDLFVHQPSSGGQVGELVYRITESSTQMHPVTRQMLHLAAHAEQYQLQIVPALRTGGVVMDRNWWSTVAYGWFDGGFRHVIDLIDFIKMAKLPTQDVEPSVVFVFMHDHVGDPHNTLALVKGYEELALEWFPSLMEPIERGTPEQVTEQIVRALEQRKLLSADVPGGPQLKDIK